MDAVDRFVEGLQQRDLDLVRGALHPDFEMVVPQRPSRGFRGRDQELENLGELLASAPDLEVRLLRRCGSGDEVWTETHAEGNGVELAVVVIWQLDAATDTLRSGRFYAEPVRHDDEDIATYMRNLTALPE